MNSPLEPPDSFHVRACVGWLELGNLAEARAELENVRPVNRDHFDVLEAEWRVDAAANDWARALETASKLLASRPEDPSAWLHKAYAIRRVRGGGVGAAAAVLIQAQTKFPEEPTIHYNLACYACQLGDLERARHWLKLAFSRGDRDQMKKMALTDSDLNPLWNEIDDL